MHGLTMKFKFPSYFFSSYLCLCKITTDPHILAHLDMERPDCRIPNYKSVLKPFYYQLMHIMLKNTELLKHSKITHQHVSVYVETIFRELQSVLG